MNSFISFIHSSTGIAVLDMERIYLTLLRYYILRNYIYQRDVTASPLDLLITFHEVLHELELCWSDTLTGPDLILGAKFLMPVAE